MRHFTILSLMMILFSQYTFSQNKPLGLFDGSADVGKVGSPGSVAYDADRQEYLIEASGTNIWFGSDEFHFAWKKLKGNFILRAHVQFLGEGVDPHRKIGWMVRPNLEGNAPHVSATVHGDGLTALQYRKAAGEDMDHLESPIVAPDVVQLERRGNTYTMSVAKYGDPFGEAQTLELDMGDEVYVGLFVCSHNNEVSEKAVFNNVRIVIPVWDDYVPYTDYIGSNLEIMDLETGLRKVIFTAPNSIQAPNWTPDGNTLIYNSDGLLYNFDLKTGKPSVLNTDFANRNNNDHVLSFDGKKIAISHHSADDEGQSVIYYLPIKGGKPKRVTPKGPSFLHSWSPDDKHLIYTGGRNGQWDIYKISVDGGEEINLTNHEALDDGSEYTPDGKYIYFNSTRTGKMKLWRMKPDGSEPTQVTFDEYNDWFPHISHDGKQIVFISYMPDMEPREHPFYKHVYLRTMPIEGGEPRVIGYLYGGQGTINVPSYSPDGKKIAFVTNSDFRGLE